MFLSPYPLSLLGLSIDISASLCLSPLQHIGSLFSSDGRCGIGRHWKQWAAGGVSRCVSHLWRCHFCVRTEEETDDITDIHSNVFSFPWQVHKCLRHYTWIVRSRCHACSSHYSSFNSLLVLECILHLRYLKFSRVSLGGRWCLVWLPVSMCLELLHLLVMQHRNDYCLIKKSKPLCREKKKTSI